MLQDFYKKSLVMAQIAYTTNEPLAQKTTFKVGGSAKLFVKPYTTEQFRSAIGGATAAELPFFVLGGGSNVVFPDTEFEAVVISTQNLSEINIIDKDDIEDNTLSEDTVLVNCQCGTPMQTFVNFCTNHNFSGAEEFAGLPGTIGGAVYMNARCFDKSISDILYQTEQIELISKIKSEITTKPFNKSEWDYKKSPFQPETTQTNEEIEIPEYKFSEHKKFVTSATFKLTKKSPEEKSQIQEECKKYINERKNKGHFNFPSAGSVFKNNHAFGAPSGKIIQDAKLLGYTIGGAQVAPFHGNIIINKENATATQIKELVQYVQKTVKEKFGFSLEPEIIFL